MKFILKVAQLIFQKIHNDFHFILADRYCLESWRAQVESRNELGQYNEERVYGKVRLLVSVRDEVV